MEQVDTAMVMIHAINGLYHQIMDQLDSMFGQLAQLAWAPSMATDELELEIDREERVIEALMGEPGEAAGEPGEGDVPPVSPVSDPDPGDLELATPADPDRFVWWCRLPKRRYTTIGK